MGTELEPLQQQYEPHAFIFLKINLLIINGKNQVRGEGFRTSSERKDCSPACCTLIGLGRAQKLEASTGVAKTPQITSNRLLQKT